MVRLGKGDVTVVFFSSVALGISDRKDWITQPNSGRDMISLLIGIMLVDSLLRLQGRVREGSNMNNRLW